MFRQILSCIFSSYPEKIENYWTGSVIFRIESHVWSHRARRFPLGPKFMDSPAVSVCVCVQTLQIWFISPLVLHKRFSLSPPLGVGGIFQMLCCFWRTHGVGCTRKFQEEISKCGFVWCTTFRGTGFKIWHINLSLNIVPSFELRDSKNEKSYILRPVITLGR